MIQNNKIDYYSAHLTTFLVSWSKISSAASHLQSPVAAPSLGLSRPDLTHLIDRLKH